MSWWRDREVCERSVNGEELRNLRNMGKEGRWGERLRDMSGEKSRNRTSLYNILVTYLTHFAFKAAAQDQICNWIDRLVLLSSKQPCDAGIESWCEVFVKWRAFGP